VAHYELGNILAGMGRRDEAREEFEAALKINPNFKGARQELEKLKR
jgi:tetratricopeptide (TPR) repeat protein